MGEDILVYLFAYACVHVSLCVSALLQRAHCCLVAVTALHARRWKISDGAASSNTEQLETDGHYWCSLSESGRKDGGEGRTGNILVLYLLKV